MKFPDLDKLDEEVKVVIVLFLIMAIIITIIGTAIVIYDAHKVQEEIKQQFEDDYIANCIPSDERPKDPTIYINNDTHTFQLQTCKWIGTNGIDMSVPVFFDSISDSFSYTGSR